MPRLLAPATPPISFRSRSAPALLIAVLCAALAVGCSDPRGGLALTPRSGGAATSTAGAAGSPVVAQPGGDFVTAIQRVAAAVKPAVVQITTEEVQQNPFAQGAAIPTGVGSGVIFDAQGHILTNNHVIEGASNLRVSLADGRSFEASVVGADPQTDLAVILIKGDNLPHAALGDSGQLQVGEWVVAIGHALGLAGGPTVTTGVVSALNRTVQEPGSQSGSGSGSSSGGGGGPFLFNVVQTDASINPGNSGGPLVNLSGQVVGLNTLVAGQTSPGGAQAEGIGFAISINTARSIADQLLRSGKVVHPYIGVRYVSLTPATAAQLGVRGVTEGALIGEIVPGSPADRAGIRAQDVITKIDGKPLQGESALAAMVDAHKPGDTITVTVLRGSNTSDVKVTLGTVPGR